MSKKELWDTLIALLYPYDLVEPDDPKISLRMLFDCFSSDQIEELLEHVKEEYAY